MRKTKLLMAAILTLTVAVSTVSTGYAAKPVNGGGGGSGPVPVAKSVCIDAGHGGSEPGTSNGAIIEKDLNLSVAMRLSEILTSKGYKTYLTRTSDVDMSKEQRYTYCNSTDASALVSVHHNGSSDHTVDRSEALYKQQGSKSLAIAVGQEVANEFGMGSTFRTVLFANMMLMKSSMPSVINEGYFLTNDGRLAQLTAEYDIMVDREANAMARGLDTYYAGL
jgi:N-acetylmuramoyl-L-alanine amidase